MLISKQELIHMGACQDGLARFITQTNNTSEQVEVSSLIGGINTYSDLLWLAGKTIDKKRLFVFLVIAH